MHRNPEVSLLERILVKGRDFDWEKKDTPKKELFKMEGLFELKDVKERIPFDAKRLKYWYTHTNSAFYSCFVKLPVGAKRSLVYVDLKALLTIVNQRALCG